MKNNLLFLLLLSITSCSSNTQEEKVITSSSDTLPVKLSPPSINKPKTVLSLKNKLQEISDLVELSCNNSRQCEIVGVGISACGGFSSYRVYSKKDTDVNQLKEKVSQFNQIIRVQNRKNKVIGICRHIEPPKTTCKQNQCTTLRNNLAL